MKTTRYILIAAAATLAFSAAQAQTVLKFSHTDQQSGARQSAAIVFAKKVEELTQGRYVVRTFCCSQLGNDPKNIEQLALGGIDFTVSATGSYATHLPTLNLTMMPFLVDNYQQGWKLYDESKWLKAQFDKAPEKGFRFLSTWEAGFRSMTTKEPLNNPADAKGKKLRTFPNEMMRWTLEAMGFNIQIMPLPEVYLAIQQGAVSGQETRWTRSTPTSFTKWHQRHADQPRLQPHPFGRERENVAEILGSRPQGRQRGCANCGQIQPRNDFRQRRQTARRHDRKRRQDQR